MANTKNTYYRNFLIFEKDDPGFGDGIEPTGYIKLEGREGKGKLLASVQNLKEDPGKVQYKLYLISCTDKMAFNVHVGIIPLLRGRGELKWDYDTENVSKTGISIFDFNVAVIAAEYSDSENRKLICPLVAYKGDKVNWRGKLRQNTFPIVSKETEYEEGAIKQNNFQTYEDKVLQNTDQYQQYQEQVTQNQDNYQQYQEQVLHDQDNYQKYQEQVLHNQDNYQKYQEQVLQNQDKYQQYEGQEIQNQEMQNQNKYQYEEEILQKQDEFQNIQNNYEPKNISSENNTETESIKKPGNIYKQENIFNCPGSTKTNSVNPCAGCYAEKLHNPGNLGQNAGVDIERLKKNFDKQFTIYDPFNSKRRDYKWWKVDSPVNLNNILYQSNIRTPLLFNPIVMMAHFKFRHLAIGMYSDRSKKREFLVCGVPGVFGIDSKPFGEMCRWIQLEGNEDKYGAFGYWIVYIDPKSGKFLNL